MDQKDRVLTFGVLTYNQENMILETLESIRFQVLAYGKKYDFKYSLLVIDDCSADNTYQTAKQWIQKHDIFYKACIIRNEANKGTVYGFRYLIEHMEDDYFVHIAGDDLIGPYDLIQYYDKLQDNDLLFFLPVLLKGEWTEPISSKVLRKYYYNKIHLDDRNYMRKAFQTGFYIFFSPALVYSRKLVQKSDYLEYSNKYRLMEDAPMLYEILKSCKDLNIVHDPKPVILYRVRMDSVSRNELNQDYLDDVQKLLHDYAADSRGFWKIYFKSEIKNHKLAFYKICNKLYSIFICLIVRIVFKSYYLRFEEHTKKYARRYESYYAFIKKECGVKDSEWTGRKL